MSNQTTISLDKLSLNYLRLLGEIKKRESGFEYSLDIWAALVANRDRLEGEGQRDHNDEALSWMADYIEAIWSEATLDNTDGYLSIASLLDSAAEAARNNPNDLFRAGAFDALADVAATFLADAYPMEAVTAKRAIYTHYGVDY